MRHGVRQAQSIGTGARPPAERIIDTWRSVSGSLSNATYASRASSAHSEPSSAGRPRAKKRAFRAGHSNALQLGSYERTLMLPDPIASRLDPGARVAVGPVRNDLQHRFRRPELDQRQADGQHRRADEDNHEAARHDSAGNAEDDQQQRQ